MTDPQQGPEHGPPDLRADRSPASSSPDLPPGQLYRVAWAFYMVLGLGGVLWIGWREKVIPLDLFIDPAGWWLDLGLGLGAGGLLILVWNLGTRGLALARDLEGRLGRLLGTLSLAEVVSLAIFSGFAEELFFRGAVQGSWGWFWASALFALLHTGPAPAFRLWTLFAAVAGGLFGGLMLWRGNLLAPMVAHFAVNAVNLYRVTRETARETASPAASE